MPGVRHELVAVLIAVVAGAGLVLLAGSRDWLITVQARPAPLPPAQLTRTGGSLLPALPALALVALACASGLVATRGLARRVVAALLGLAGAGAAALVIGALVRHDVAAGWPIVALLGAVIVAGAAVVALRYGSSWPSMGSRYARTPAPRQQPHDGRAGAGADQGTAASQTALWDALDRGDDPTR